MLYPTRIGTFHSKRNKIDGDKCTETFSNLGKVWVTGGEADLANGPWPILVTRRHAGLRAWAKLPPVGDILVYDTNTICVLMHSYGRTDLCVCVYV